MTAVYVTAHLADGLTICRLGLWNLHAGSQRVFAARDCPGKLIHDMRRSAVRTFERAGVPRSVAMSIVGHKTESIYRRYAIVDETMQREAAARLDAWMALPAIARSTSTVAPLRQGNRRRDRATG